MKFIKTAAFCLLIILGSCTPFHWERNVEKHGIRFTKLRQDKRSGIMIGFTAKAFQQDSFEVEKGWVHFYPDWELRTFQTSRPVKLKEFTLPAKTWISFDSLKTCINCVLPKNQVVQGIECRGGGGESGVYAGFYPSGRLKGCYPVHDIIVDGIPCSNSLFFPVSFYENGHLKSCKLSGSFSYRGKIIKKSTKIQVQPDGTIDNLTN